MRRQYVTHEVTQRIAVFVPFRDQLKKKSNSQQQRINSQYLNYNDNKFMKNLLKYKICINLNQLM